MAAVKNVYFSLKIQSQQSAKYRSSAANFVLCTPDSPDGRNMEPTGKVPLQTLRKRAGTFKEYLAGVWTDLFITVYQDSINGKRDTHHYWEDDGEEGGLQDPEDSQTDDLNEGEKMDASQRNVTQEGEVRLVFGRHQIQLDPLPELEQKNSLVSTNVNHVEVKQLEDTLIS